MSAIELDLITGFALVVAYLLTFGTVLYGAGLLTWHALEWIEAWRERRRMARLPAPTPITVTQRRAGGTVTTTARVRHLVIVPESPHRPWVEEADMDLLEVVDPKREGLRCPQGLRVIHRGGAK